MKFKQSIVLLLGIILMQLLFSLTSGQISTKIDNSCTIFSVSIGDTTYFGNNEDYPLDGTYLWLIPRQDYQISGETLSLPGIMGLGFDHNDPPDPGDGRIQGGMNEYGLCWDANGLPPIPMYWNTSGKEPWIFNYSIWIWMQPLLECKNIAEIINWFNTYDLGDIIGGQHQYCDAEGNAVVVSVNSTGNFTYSTMGSNHFLVSTNFNVAWPENHYDPYPCPRYETATAMLNAITTENQLTIKACQDILETVSVPQTAYSNIFDPVHQDLYININQDFSKIVKLNLHEELGNVKIDDETTQFHESYYYQQIKLSDLFERIIPGYNPLIVIGSIFVGICSLTIILLQKNKWFTFNAS